MAVWLELGLPLNTSLEANTLLSYCVQMYLYFFVAPKHSKKTFGLGLQSYYQRLIIFRRFIWQVKCVALLYLSKRQWTMKLHFFNSDNFIRGICFKNIWGTRIRHICVRYIIYLPVYGFPNCAVRQAPYINPQLPQLPDPTFRIFRASRSGERQNFMRFRDVLRRNLKLQSCESVGRVRLLFQSRC